MYANAMSIYNKATHRAIGTTLFKVLYKRAPGNRYTINTENSENDASDDVIIAQSIIDINPLDCEKNKNII